MTIDELMRRARDATVPPRYHEVVDAFHAAASPEIVLAMGRVVKASEAISVNQRDYGHVDQSWWDELWEALGGLRKGMGEA
jgi:hypothetical protein